MFTADEAVRLVKTITTLSQALPPSVLKATTNNKIWQVMHGAEGESPFQTFNQCFDALFVEDCRDSEGNLQHIRQGKSGMGLVCTYLRKLNWSQGFPLDLVEIKLKRLTTELNNIMYVSYTFVTTRRTDTNSGRNVDEPKSTCQTNLASKLRDANNTHQPELSFQRKAVKNLQAAQGPPPSPPPPETLRSSTRSTSEPHEVAEALGTESVVPEAIPKAPTKRTTVVEVDDEDEDAAQTSFVPYDLFHLPYLMSDDSQENACQAWKSGR